MRIDMFNHENDYMVDEIRHRDLIRQSSKVDIDQCKPMSLRIKFVTIRNILGFWGKRFSAWGFKLQQWAGNKYNCPVINPSNFRMRTDSDPICKLLEN